MKIIKKLLVLIIAFVFFIPNVKAENEVNLYLFYSDVCSTCAAEEVFLKNIEDDYPNLNIITFEVTKIEENDILLSDVRSALKNKDMTVPYTVIGTTGITGFSPTVENQIKAAIERYSANDYVDIVDVIKNNLDVEYEIHAPEGEFNLPFFGNVDPKKVSLPLISIVIGAIDGFNPCAMWVLIFLITMLFNMKDKKRMWILGITFLIASALIYLIFMMAWLQIAISLTKIIWVRILIALVALVGGLINLRSYYRERKKDSGCEVVDDKKRKKMFTKIRKFTSEKSLALAIVGIIGLAVSVNLVELACSSGLPLIYTQILALNDLSQLQYLIYILIYILFFLIDDILVFVIAMKTLSITGISTKYTKFSHLIGGIIMVIIGLLMIFKPEWIMFHF